ncbi:MAG: leucine-rich repeat domain-containing protein, partial [Promethearchaeota archaeon]
VEVMRLLEEQIGKPILQVTEVFGGSFGFTAKLNRVTGLELSGQGVHSLPESFGNLSNLKTLYLSQNELSSLPESFGRLTSLQTLSLAYNQLTSLPEWKQISCEIQLKVFWCHIGITLLLELETVKIHNFIPSTDKILYKFLFRVVTSVNFS